MSRCPREEEIEDVCDGRTDEITTTRRVTVVALGAHGTSTQKKSEIQTKTTRAGGSTGIIQRHVKAEDDTQVTRKEEVIAIRTRDPSC